MSESEARALHGHEYAERFERSQGRRRILQLLPHLSLSKGDDLVDFACGNGLLAAEVWDRVRSYTGVDFSPPFIELAEARAARLSACNVHFACSSIESYCAANLAQFDVACAFDFSEHVRDEEWLGMLASMRSALKTEGRLYLHTPNAGFVLERMKAANFILRQSPEHVAVRDMASNLRLLREAGFRIQNARVVRHYNVLRFADGLRHLPVIGRWFEARLFIEAMRR